MTCNAKLLKIGIISYIENFAMKRILQKKLSEGGEKSDPNFRP